MVCIACFADLPHVRSSKRFCGDTCRQAFHRRQARLRVPGAL